METGFNRRCIGSELAVASACDPRMDFLVGRLPSRLGSIVRWLRRPSSLWIRAPVAVLLVCGGLFGFFPVLGFWMLPIGMVLLADDLQALRPLRTRILDWIERRRPHWLPGPDAADSSG